ncbi:Chitin synthase, class 2 [Chytridiales sp. JEL 0842]|nr:Chitin synthase, class 2 [Chytridiales sp. JEL 0842]
MDNRRQQQPPSLQQQMYRNDNRGPPNGGGSPAGSAPGSPYSQTSMSSSSTRYNNSTPMQHSRNNSNPSMDQRPQPPPQMQQQQPRMQVPPPANPQYQRQNSYPMQQMHSPSPMHMQQPQMIPPPQPQMYAASPQMQMQPMVPPAQAQAHAQKRRQPEHRNVALTAQGNLVLDIPVPDRVLQLNKAQGMGDEFTYMRYTAATCTADEFSTKGYSLRQQEYKRKTEIFIVVTMYNENDELFCKTMLSLYKNIAYLCQRTRSTTWGAQGWQSAVICIVSDGRTKINPRVLNVLGIMGVYQEGIMKNTVNDRQVTAHIFEYTTSICVDAELNIRGADQGMVPVQILFCLKEKNAKKINSHRWFFNAFGPLLRPNVCMLIDVGTKPSHTSIYHLWKAFDRDPQVGGACGEIYAELGTGCMNLLNPLVAGQNFEYKMSNILDKPMESAFGYISVLPGAFSAYRYVALQGLPLQQYFKGEVMHDGNNIFAANMYLAEDRILCFELVTKEKSNWVLRYVKSAKAETDVPDNVPEFISQRRRWLNGSFFAGIHALSHWYHIFRSNHSILRKLAFLIEFTYNFISTVFNWFGVGNFYLVFHFLLKDPQVVPPEINISLREPLGPEAKYVFSALQNLYIMSLCLIVICSLGNRPQGSKITYTFTMVLFALIMGVMLYVGVFNIYVNVLIFQPTAQNFVSLFSRPVFRDIVISLGSSYGMYLISSLLYLEPWHIFTSMIQYLFLLPSYVNILMVYAFCNLHDVSWGTKGDNAPSTDLGAVKTSKGADGKETIQVDIPTDKNDINAGYDRFVSALRQPRPDEKKKRDAKTKQEDYFKNFRTQVIVWWMLSNGILVILFTSDFFSSKIFAAFNGNYEQLRQNGQNINGYLTFIFWSNVFLSGFRFLGSLVYLVLNLMGC